MSVVSVPSLTSKLVTDVPICTRVNLVLYFKTLDINGLISFISARVVQCNPPCQNGATCREGTCICHRGYSGQACERIGMVSKSIICWSSASLVFYLFGPKCIWSVTKSLSRNTRDFVAKCVVDESISTPTVIGLNVQLDYMTMGRTDTFL